MWNAHFPGCRFGGWIVGMERFAGGLEAWPLDLVFQCAVSIVSMSQDNPLVPASQSGLVLSPKKNPVLGNMVGDALALARAQVELEPRDYLPSAQSSMTIPWLGLELMPIPAGEFLMGSPEDEEDRYDNETQHLVKISRPYWMGKYPVTQGQWESVMGDNPSQFKEAGKDAPVEQVSWEDAMEFCQEVNLREADEGRLPQGYEFTLPTEVQWEYACRAGTTTAFHFGGILSSHQANFDGRYPYGDAEKGSYLGTTTPVGKYPPNAWGLYDMHGNVWEWCQDFAGGVGRGCSWGSNGNYCRSACSVTFSLGNRGNSLGFRLCLSPLNDKWLESSQGTSLEAKDAAAKLVEIAIKKGFKYENLIYEAGKQLGRDVNCRSLIMAITDAYVEHVAQSEESSEANYIFNLAGQLIKNQTFDARHFD
jgi:formylglycine-generating enzyme required for sulfatase activity